MIEQNIEDNEQLRTQAHLTFTDLDRDINYNSHTSPVSPLNSHIPSPCKSPNKKRRNINLVSLLFRRKSRTAQ